MTTLNRVIDCVSYRTISTIQADNYFSLMESVREALTPLPYIPYYPETEISAETTEIVLWQGRGATNGNYFDYVW